MSVPKSGKLYRFRCTGIRRDGGGYESTKYLQVATVGTRDISDRSNVCLFKKEDKPNQVWKLEKSVLKSMRNKNYAITIINNPHEIDDCNTEVRNVGQPDQEFEFIPTGKENTVYIKLKSRERYLTANSTSNGTPGGKSDISVGNVFLGRISNSNYQEWEYETIESIDDIINLSRHPYGAIINPVTKELCPISYYKNGVDYSDSNYELEKNKKTTRLEKSKFDVAKFFAGLEFDSSFINSNHPRIGSLSAIIIGGISALEGSWNTIYMDVDYYKIPSTGQKKAIIRCGELKYCKLFENWVSYGITKSLKSVHNIWSGCTGWPAVKWEKDVNDMAKELYGKIKKIKPNDEYKYDIEFTLDKKRETDKYVSYIFLGKDGSMYEYSKLYNTEKIEIVVTKKGIKNLFDKKVDRLNIIPFISPISKLPDDKAKLFNITTLK